MTLTPELFAVLSLSAAGLFVCHRFERGLSTEAWATGTALISCVVLVLNYLRERGPAKAVNERLNTLEADVTKLKDWKNTP